MQRASESIGALAAALAKAQIELVNPEKSLVATIRQGGRPGREQTFRYAPLSSGLEIVRKVLGWHEIATMQTTFIDQAAGFVNLTSVLAHASEEWIASDWPVCPVSEVASPGRMGAALTYARRYALFALVGIAGEDDLDAPDLNTPTGEIAIEPAAANGGGPVRGGQHYFPPQTASHRHGKPKPPTTNPTLGLHASAKLRERLIAEIKELGSGEDAATWAQRSLAEKNRLRTSDAAQVESMFEARLANLATLSARESQANVIQSATALDSSNSEPSAQTGIANDRARQKGIDKSVLSMLEARRVRDRDHVRSVSQKPCLVCGRRPSDPHHLLLPKAVLCLARSVTSLSFRCVAGIIVKSITAGMKWDGGGVRKLTRLA
jgi:hypothetical protein